MATRREIIAGGLASAAMSGCTGGNEARVEGPEGLPPVPVDIHNHIFNAQDIPISGFAEQVLLRHPETPVPGGPSVARSLIRLIVDIVLASRGTPSAAREYRDLEGLSRLQPRDGGELLRQDQRAVARGLQILESKTFRASALRSDGVDAPGVTPEPSGDELLFARLAAETGQTQQFAPSGLADPARRGQPGATANRIAAEIYRDAGRATFRTLAERPAPDQSLAQTLRWAGLLTRSRVDILGELLRLYGHQSTTTDPKNSNGAKVFSPSLVDFTYWLRAWDDKDPEASGRDILEQIKVTSRIAKLERRALILPFAPFCPLRAAVYRKRYKRNWLGEIQRAVETQGFAGIKLYPPMGFVPFGNVSLKPPRAMRELGITGQEIDMELRRLYAWCADQEVPIKSHGNNSLGADACTGQNAAAENWRRVLSQPGWNDLQINIAHFGGFEETRFDTETGCPPQSENYETQAARLMTEYDHLYVDLGYWTDVTGSNRIKKNGDSVPQLTQTALSKMQEILKDYPELRRRLMYGSDWSMIGRENQHAGYYRDTRIALQSLLPDPKDRMPILGANALRYLGLDRRGKQYERLARFFEDAPQFTAVMDLLPNGSLLGALFGARL